VYDAIIVLNALRHQRNDRFLTSVFFQSGRVLNALRHQRNDRFYEAILIHASKVLNALRHQRNDCAVVFHQYGDSFRAQRLTASKERSLVSTVFLFCSYWCSTPYGIKGTIADT